MGQWCKYIHWYSKVALSPDVTLEDFFDAPIVKDRWRILALDQEMVRFGHLWPLYDMVSDKGLDPKVPILDSALRKEFGCMGDVMAVLSWYWL